MSDPGAVLIGESFIGEGAEAAHISVVLGHRSGPVGTAWATAHATLTWGAAQAGVAGGVADALADSRRSQPTTAEVLAARTAPVNPYYQAR